MTPTVSQSSASEPARMTLQEKGALLVLCGAIFLEGLDIAMLNVALPHIRVDLGLSTTTLSAVVSSYVIGYAGFMLLGGRICDLYGRRRVFLIALGVFVVLSGLGGLATEGWMLLAARFITGMSAAFMTPAGLSLITTNFPEGPRRNKAVLIYAGAASAGYSLGLVVGGVLTAISWRWVFFAPAIMAALILLLAVKLIADAHRPEARRKFDLIGALVLTSAMLFAAIGIARLENPQEYQTALVACVVSAALWVIFVLIERRTNEPLIRLGILRSGSLVRANLSMLLFGGSFFGFQFVVTLYLQELLGWTPLQTGLAVIVVSIDAILAPTLTPVLVNRFGNVRIIVVGLALAALAYALFLRLGLDWTYAAMFPTMLVLGVGFALAYGPLTIVATNGVVENEQGLASSLVNTSFQFGAGLGLSAVGALAVLGLGGDGGVEARLEALRMAMLVPVAAAAVAAFVMMTTRRERAGAISEQATALSSN
ncbi:MFS transporter [Pelagibacterium limicola]|uniref:MFS transporter n=1 Tax=Pelagibacterium limicola TaxID=2791022 RepID=UPI001A9A70BD|nr:MFS transporter [Pelagibacterium limicola]